MKNPLSILIICLMVLVTTACEDEDTKNVDAKELVTLDCKSTGQSFVYNEQVCAVYGRGCIKYEDIPTRYHVYDCPGKGRVLSKFKLEYRND